MHFFENFYHLRIKLQTSFEALNFVLLLFLSLHSSSSTFKLLSMASYGGELLLDSSSPWSGISNHLSPSPFHCNQTSRSKWLHWWRRSKAYKLHRELHQRPLMSCLQYISLWDGMIRMKDIIQWLRNSTQGANLNNAGWLVRFNRLISYAFMYVKSIKTCKMGLKKKETKFYIKWKGS